MDMYAAVVTAVWVMLPAYVPNNAAMLAGGGRPIDGGWTWGGRCVLGDRKTGQGIVAGLAAGAALVLTAVHEPASDLLGVAVPAFALQVMFALPLGAMLADIGTSFLKRRIGRERGAPAVGLETPELVAVTRAFNITNRTESARLET